MKLITVDAMFGELLHNSAKYYKNKHLTPKRESPMPITSSNAVDVVLVIHKCVNSHMYANTFSDKSLKMASNKIFSYIVERKILNQIYCY